MTLGERVRALRHDRGLRRAEAARAASVTGTWLSRVERGHIPRPDPEALARLAAVLGVSVQSVLSGDPDASPSPPPPATTPEQNRALIADLVGEVVNHGNLAVADLALASAYTIHGPFPDILVSRAVFRRLIARMRRAFPDIHVRLDDVVADAERVVVRWTLTGTHLGAARGVTPTGARITHAGIAIFGIGDGQVTDAWMSADASDRDLFRQLGLGT